VTVLAGRGVRRTFQSEVGTWEVPSVKGEDLEMLQERSIMERKFRRGEVYSKHKMDLEILITIKNMPVLAGYLLETIFDVNMANLPKN